jgi:hypothetical protein
VEGIGGRSNSTYTDILSHSRFHIAMWPFREVLRSFLCPPVEARELREQLSPEVAALGSL